MPRYARRRKFAPRRRFGRRRRAGGFGGAIAKYAPMAARAWAVGKAAYRGVRYIKGLVNSEMYKFDQAPAAFTTTIAGYQDGLFQVAQGDGDGSRTGNSIMVKSIRIEGVFRNAASTPVPNVRCKVVLIRDDQTVSDSLYPALSDVYEYTADQTIIHSPLNSVSVGRYSILAQRIVFLDILAHPQSEFMIRLPMSHHVRFNGTAGTDIQKGNVSVSIFCDNTNVAYTNPTCEFSWRVSYHDN